jgi:hypothetical protein
MAVFLTRRHGTWHFVRRVPIEFASFDRRGIIKHSTKVRIVDDRNGRKASRVAQQLNEQLEAYWCSLASRNTTDPHSRYEAARRRARSLGFDYVENQQLVSFPLELMFERLDALVSRKLTEDVSARSALLGVEKRPVILLSRLFEEFEAAVADEIKDYSPEQKRIGAMRASGQLPNLSNASVIKR